jgi:hypothetical protein
MGFRHVKNIVARLLENAYDVVTQEGKAGLRLFVLNSARTRKRDGNAGLSAATTR